MGTIWTQEDIDKFKANDDPNYVNTDWRDLTLRKFAPQTQHNLSVRGGTEKVKYFISGGFFHQGGLYRSKDMNTKKINLRADDPNPVSATKIEDVGYYKWNTFSSDNKLRFSYKLPLGFTSKALFN